MHWWLLITRRWFFFAFAGTLLGSAAPPASFALAPQARLAAENCAGRAVACAPHLDPVAGADSALPRLAYRPVDLPPVVVARDTPRWEQLREVQPAAEGVQSRTADPAKPKAWQPPASGGAGVKVVISIPQQKAYVFRDGDLFGISPVSTGKPGHPTPVGTFRISQKKVHHRSNRYANAPMPYMQRLTDYGIAIHAGALPGYPASHGCIRLPRSFAKKLYDITTHGTPVTITNQRPDSPEDARNLA